MFDRENAFNAGAKVWFITGISRGMGKDLAEAVLRRGDVVIGTTRSGEASLDAHVLEENRAAERLHVLPMDLTQPKQIQDAVVQAQALYNRLDVIVNNAGYHLLGAIEEATEEEIAAMFSIDFFGPLHVIRAALPFLREQRAGRILNVSSVAGFSPKAGYGLYVAAKCAMNGLSESLAQEVAPLGIKVTLVVPGSFRTEFVSDPPSCGIADYAATAHAFADRVVAGAGKQAGDPKRAALAMIQVGESENPPIRLFLGTDAVHRTRENQAAIATDLDAWESVSTSTDFPDGN